MKRNTIKTIAFLLSFTFAGCSNFLTVEPKSSVAEDKMFSSAESFQQALTGVYSQLATQSLYGDRLSLGFVSALAQNYGVDWAGQPYDQTHKLVYNSNEVVGHLTAIWQGSYNAIAGLNKILVNTDERRSLLTDEVYGLIRGEALGLRALLHFELLRIYGPEYIAGSGKKAIPYKTVTEPLNTEPSTTAEVMDKVLLDLAEAEGLLKQYDEVTETTRINRRIKLNYYAVKGLEARVRMYKGDKTGAFDAAKVVVDSEVFTFVTAAQAGASIGSRDRLYVNELLFAIRSTGMQTWVDQYFKFNMHTSAKLTRTRAEIEQLYENSTTDIRKLYLFDESQGALFPSKFWQDYVLTGGQGSTSIYRLDQLVPVIRLSEMYYIMAETANTPEEGYNFLNAVRSKRGIEIVANPNISWETLETEIRKEYQKEFYAEGQLFFYYKRKNFTRMQFLNQDVPLSIYQLPIPADELEYNPNY